MRRHPDKVAAETGSPWPYTQPAWIFSRRMIPSIEGANTRFVQGLDELIVQVGSVTLGKGKPLFPRRVANPPRRLVSVRQVGTGFAELRYEVRGSDTAGVA